MKIKHSVVSGACGLVLAATFGLASNPAGAAVYRGVFDPEFGNPFNNPLLGWRGTATFDVSDNCLPAMGLVMVGGDCDAEVTQAKVEFYDVNQFDQPTLASIDFALDGLAYESDDYAISRLFFQNSKLVGLDALLTGFKTPVMAPTAGRSFEDVFGNNTEFALEFNLGALVSPNDGPYNGPRLSWKRGVGCADCNGFNSNANVPTFTITDLRTGEEVTAPSAVPEPGSLALVSLALVTAGAVARRRRAA